jgi:hypothetical protein
MSVLGALAAESGGQSSRPATKQLARPIKQASGIKQGGLQNCPNQLNGRKKHFRHGRAAAAPLFSSSL